MAPLNTWQAIALIAAPVAAAIAACASWATVFQARKSTCPLLNVKIVNRTDTEIPCRGLVIANAGGGMARGVLFFIADDAGFAQGFAQHGFLRSGDMVDVTTSIPSTDAGARAFALCRGADSFSRVWTHKEKGYTMKQKRNWASRFRALPKYQDLEDTYREVFPDAPDPAELREGNVLAVKIQG